MIPRVDVEAGKKARIVQFVIEKNLKPMVENRGSLFDRSQFISSSLAKKMLTQGYKQASKFGRWCPVEVRLVPSFIISIFFLFKFVCSLSLTSLSSFYFFYILLFWSLFFFLSLFLLPSSQFYLCLSIFLLSTFSSFFICILVSFLGSSFLCFFHLISSS